MLIRKFRFKVISRLYDVTRLLLRDLMANPLAVSALIRHREQWAIEPSSSCRKLVSLLVHLRTLTRNELLTTQKAKIKRDDFLDRLHRKDLEQTKQIEILTETYNHLKSAQLSQVSITDTQGINYFDFEVFIVYKGI
ncbi:unnamed protein product [Trichobilharzia regenti]|nr:unnamed protein product [Trichobilharzia regenti]